VGIAAAHWTIDSYAKRLIHRQAFVHARQDPKPAVVWPLGTVAAARCPVVIALDARLDLVFQKWHRKLLLIVVSAAKQQYQHSKMQASLFSQGFSGLLPRSASLWASATAEGFAFL
jgi:hypothetical protein